MGILKGIVMDKWPEYTFAIQKKYIILSSYQSMYSFMLLWIDS